MAGRGKKIIIRGVEYQSINDVLVFYGLNRNSYTNYKNPNMVLKVRDLMK